MEAPKVRLRLQRFRGPEPLLGSGRRELKDAGALDWLQYAAVCCSPKVADIVAWRSSTFAARRAEKHW